jgi:hypothetical protein
MTHTPPIHELRPLNETQLKMLMTDLNSDRVAVKQRMSYLEAWDVKATLIRVFGFGGFSSELIESKILKAVEAPQSGNKDKNNWEITAQATVRLSIHQLGAVYTETAIAGSKQPDFTESADMAIKSAESDALKRAAIFLGTQFGLSLYNSGATQEIVKSVLADGQEFLRGARVLPAGEKEALDRIAAGEGPRPASAGDSVHHLKPEDISDEKHEENKALLNNALSAQVAKQKERRTGADVPVALDTSLDDATAAADEEARGAYNN